MANVNVITDGVYLAGYEEWKPIPSLKGMYSASTWGRVRHNLTGTVYDARLASNGYLRVPLLVDGRRRSRPIYLLVCEAFHGPRPKRFVVDHINADKRDNRPENLEWVSIAENVRRAKRNNHLEKLSS